MATARKAAPISEAEYLEGEKISDIKHEFVDGYVYAMTGAKAAHNRIAGNVHAAFHAHLRGKPCQPFMSDMKVKVGSKYFYPDVLVDCSDLPGDAYFTEQPVIIVEVLSSSTRRMDETTKRVAYMQIPSLQAYVLIEQDFVDVEVSRRSSGWVSEHYFMGDSVGFEAIGLVVAVEEIYERVENGDVKAWMESRLG